MKLFGSMSANEKGHLEIGGCDVIDLARNHGTPSYVFDEGLIRSNCQSFIAAASNPKAQVEVIYASKAFLNLAMCKLIEEEGLSLDVVSGGELYTALAAGFPSESIYMHGNNKSYTALQMAVSANIHRIIVDNRVEIQLLEEICQKLNKEVDILLRVNPGIEAHTHEYIQTATYDSKFGESIFSDSILEIVKTLKNSQYLSLKGFHCHIGSQIFEEEPYFALIKTMFNFIKKISLTCHFNTQELNLGGGFGTYYVKGDQPLSIDELLPQMIDLATKEAQKNSVQLPKLLVEPGRALVSNAGTTLYSVGSTKETYVGKRYIFIDGGMADNIRPALYGAEYEAVIANKMHHDSNCMYTVVGNCCENDTFIRDIKLAEAKRGDILAVGSTGAYSLSMSSNYNSMPRPAVLFVRDGNARLVTKRESYDDLIANYL